MMVEFKEQLEAIVGQSRVFVDADLLSAYGQDRSLTKPMRPKAVVKIQNVTEVEQIVRWANETLTPLVPVSSSGPHHRGDTVPSVPGAVIVDLSGMKQILSINRTHRMAVIEPGVTYEELQAALAAEGMAISSSLAPKAGKSVVASVLEVEPRLNALHQWNYVDPLRCTEVVWGDGNRINTGEAGATVPDLQQQWAAEKWQVSGAGPMMLDFYRLLTGAQGSMGIVTWASIKCEVLPSIHQLYLVPSQQSEQLHDFVYQVTKFRFGSELLMMNGACLAALLGESAEQYRDLRDRLPQWIALAGVAGRELLPEERVAAQQQDIADIARQCGLEMVPSVPGANGSQVLAKILNPSAEKYWKTVARGGFQEIFFVTTLDQTPTFIEAMNALATAAGYPVEDIGVYIQPLHMGTSYHCEFIIPYNPADPAETARVGQLITKASETFSSMGAYYSRPYGAWARLQLNKDAQSAITLRKLKGIFDPNNIMNPGKVSI